MTQPSALVLDHAKNISVPPGAAAPFNNFVFYQNIDGLHKLAHQIRMEENLICERQPLAFVLGGGFSPYIGSTFNWFAITFVNHLRLIALAQLMMEKNWTTKEILANPKETKTRCKQFVEEVDSELFHWRNKVAAHPAGTDPRADSGAKSDTEKLLDQTLFIPVCYRAGYLEVGNMHPIDMEGKELPIWQLTRKFEDHSKRFWPDAKLPPRSWNPYRRHTHVFGTRAGA